MSRPHSDSFLSKEVLEHRYFFLPPSIKSNSRLRVVCGGWERCAPNYKIERSQFEYYGLEYVSSGSGCLDIHGQQHQLLPGSVFAYGPSTPHTIRSDPGNPLIKYFIDSLGSDAKRLILQRRLGTLGIVQLYDSQPIHDIYEQMLDAGQRGGPLAWKICITLFELMALRLEENELAPGELHNRSRQSFERCQLEIRNHFRTISSVEELAGRIHLDRAYLSRLCKRFTGESPHQMLIRYKMSEAGALLYSGRYIVKEVATEVGFSDPYHFSRCFKNYYGVSPTLFRDIRELRPL